MFAPLPKVAESRTHPVTPEKVALGKKLFFEKLLSKQGDLSCNSCHDLAKYGMDGTAVSSGHLGRQGLRNAPTVYNAALHLAQFWDGRAKDVEDQALGPFLEPGEMAMRGQEQAITLLRESKEYPLLFQQAFPEDKDPVSFVNIGLAIGAFERTLLTPSRFDQFLSGNESALTEGEKNGLAAFVTVGCTNCHRGVAVGGGMFQKVGVVKPYLNQDVGRYAVTKKEADFQVFKVPSLRNVEKTAPYFHDGSIASLSEAVTLMGRHQLGLELTAEQVESVVTFLKSLTGELPNFTDK